MQSTATAPSPLTAATKHLAQGLSEAGRIYWDCVKDDPDLSTALGRALHQEPSPQAAKMAALVIIQNLAQVRPRRNPNITKITRIWENAVYRQKSNNYRPGMELALDLLNILQQYKKDRWDAHAPINAHSAVLAMCKTAELIEHELPGNDLAGRLLQELPHERKELSNYHTRPWAATLMAHLAIPEDFDWSDPKKVKEFRIADYACGSGVLLMAGYRRIRELHAAQGGDPARIHQHMMEHSITGCDVLPACTSICSSNLATIEASKLVWKTRIITFERDRDKGSQPKRLGSPDLLDPGLMALQSLIAVGPRKLGEQTRVTFKRDDQDAILINPPFGATQAGNAAAESSDGSGMSCKFAHMAHQKVRRGGVIAMTLPGTALIGMTNRPKDQPQGWQSFREILMTQYTEIKVLSIAQYNDQDSSFSHDTNIAEIMVIARRLRVRENAPKTAHFINLTRQARDDEDAAAIARAIKETIKEAIKDTVQEAASPEQSIQRIHVGEEDLGTTVLMPLTKQGAWPMAKNLNPELLVAARAMAQNRPRPNPRPNPRTNDLPIPIINLRTVAKQGPTTRSTSAEPLTPIESPPKDKEQIPVLNGLNCKTQISMNVAPTHWIADPGRIGADVLTARLNSAGQLHLSTNMRYTSQRLAAAFTPKTTIGGRSWTTLKVHHSKQGTKALTAWLNSTVGMITCWPYLHHAQNGTGFTTPRQTDGLPVLDLNSIGKRSTWALAEAFDSMANTELMPACDAWQDPKRKELDQKVLAALGLEDPAAHHQLEWLRNNWCMEPTVQGKKGQVKHRRADMQTLAELADAILPPKPERVAKRTYLRKTPSDNSKPANTGWNKSYNPNREAEKSAVEGAEAPPTTWNGIVYSIHITERILPGNPPRTETVCGIAVLEGNSVTHAQRQSPDLQMLHPNFWCDKCLDIADEEIPQRS